MLCIVETRPFDPAPMIGTGGTMKFAIQAMLAGHQHPGTWDLKFRTNSDVRSPILKDVTPTVEPMKRVMDAAVNHWRELGREVTAAVEVSPSAVIAIMSADELLANAQRGPLTRVCRGIGKANGYGGTIIIDKIKSAAR